MPDTDANRVIYLGRSRLHRMRANLIQTIHTVGAIHRLGQPITLVLPRGGLVEDKAGAIQAVGGDPAIDLQTSWLMRPGLKFAPYLRRHARRLRAAGAVYTRVPEIALALGEATIPHHLEVHDVEGLAAKGQLAPLVERHRAGTLRTLIPISQPAVGMLVDAGADPARIHVAPSGVSVAAYADVPAFDPATLDRPRVVNLGQLNPKRGLAVFDAVARSGLAQVDLVGRMDGAAKALDTLPDVTAHAPVPPGEVPGWYARCDLVLLPYQSSHSRAQSFSPIKLFEAMAAGRPILASDLPSIRGAVTHEHDALLLPDNDPAAWVDAIKRLQQDRDLAQRLATNAKANAQKYDWSTRASGILRAIGLRQVG
ncbi:MAG: glycosyltransferase family 4 protein [Planctomycetota bacterium]